MRRSKEEIAAEKKMKAERREHRHAAMLASCADRFGSPCGARCERGCARAKAEREKSAARIAERKAAERAAKEASDQRVKDRLAPAPLKRSKDLTPHERALLRIAKLEKEKGKNLKLAGIEYDPRTAAGQREYDVASMGGTKRARVDRHSALFRNRGEATKVRILACEKFDEMRHAAEGGLYPSQKYEPGVDVSGFSTAIEDRAAGLQAQSHLKAAMGDHLFAIMDARIYESMNYMAMERAGLGDRRDLPVLFVAAVDAVARYFRIGAEPKKPSASLPVARLFPISG
ncbi:hypothetical protein [Bosea minatitlanensis]|uniref:Uncharacterized protein n=1 Tax=Bosea minatitlanensis TaxID=128782 RepID=A0ABW0EZZ1_9HYPH|nr:hypothetical protein [Bosea minatitlanensis]MCT4492742.1 hypothetical protein [Bosea minatitlanensis]